MADLNWCLETAKLIVPGLLTALANYVVLVKVSPKIAHDIEEHRAKLTLRNKLAEHRLTKIIEIAGRLDNLTNETLLSVSKEINLEDKSPANLERMKQSIAVSQLVMDQVRDASFRALLGPYLSEELSARSAIIFQVLTIRTKSLSQVQAKHWIDAVIKSRQDVESYVAMAEGDKTIARTALRMKEEGEKLLGPGSPPIAFGAIES